MNELPLESGVLTASCPDGWNCSALPVKPLNEGFRASLQRRDADAVSSASAGPHQMMEYYTGVIEKLLREFWMGYNTRVSPFDPALQRIVAQLEAVRRKLDGLSESYSARNTGSLNVALLNPDGGRSQAAVVNEFALPLKERIGRVLDVHRKMVSVLGGTEGGK